MEFVLLKGSQNLNLMKNMSTKLNQQHSRYMFSKLIECLKQTIREQIGCKRQSSKYKTNEQSEKCFNWNMQIEI